VACAHVQIFPYLFGQLELECVEPAQSVLKRTYIRNGEGGSLSNLEADLEIETRVVTKLHGMNFQ
jgi:hypothetical protein